MAGSICSVPNGSQTSGSLGSSRASAQNDAAASKPAAARLPAGLTPQQQVLTAELAAADRHVRAHEQAHLSAAGPFATSGASYSVITGPDGKQYAVSGEVSLDTSPVLGDPAATIQKARVIEAAANAPADPSSQDWAVATAAAAMEQAAEMELANSQQATAPSRVASAYGQQSGAEDTQHLLSMTA